MASIQRGWFRLLIALSIAWFAAVLGFGAFEYFQRNPFDQFAGGRIPPQYVLWEWSPIDLLAPEDKKLRTFDLKIGKVFVLLLGPVAFLWLAAWCVGWIYEGFKSSQ